LPLGIPPDNKNFRNQVSFALVLFGAITSFFIADGSGSVVVKIDLRLCPMGIVFMGENRKE
jgi:hypothetical protein